MYKVIHFILQLKNTLGIMWWVVLLMLWPISHITQTTITLRNSRTCIPLMYCDLSLTNTPNTGNINHGHIRQAD